MLLNADSVWVVVAAVVEKTGWYNVISIQVATELLLLLRLGVYFNTLFGYL